MTYKLIIQILSLMLIFSYTKAKGRHLRWGDSCSACPAGTYNDQVGKGECKPCTYGTQNQEKGAIACKKCPIGTYTDKLQTITCKKCNVGTYTDTTGNKICKKCEKGHYQDKIGKTACVKCPIGTYNPATGSDELKDCLQCTRGNSCNTRSLVNPVDCPTGTQNDKLGQIKCRKCQIGTYNNLVEQNKCKLCPAGYYGTIIGGKTKKSACKKCKKGTQNANLGEDECSPCPKNTYCDVEGLKKPKPCPDNHFTSDTGNDHCVACPKGTIGYDIDSVIVDSPKLLTKVTKLQCEYKLCYRGSKHGYNSKTFHKNCDDVSPTITLVKSTNGRIFGGQTDDLWGPKGSQQSSDKSFLFSLDHKGRYDITTGQKKRYATYNSQSQGPTFGGGHDIQLNLNAQNSKSQNGQSNFGHSYTSPSGIKYGTTAAGKQMAGKKQFKYKDVEVFGVNCSEQKELKTQRSGSIKNPIESYTLILSDATGSMGSTWKQSKSIVKSILNNMGTMIGDIGAKKDLINIKWVAQKDYKDKNTIQESEWTNDANKLIKFINSIKISGGGDLPEAVEKALEVANKEPKVTQVILIADAEPHLEKLNTYLSNQKVTLKTTQKIESKKLGDSGIPVQAFQTRNRAPLVKSFNEIARITGGTSQLLKLNNLKNALAKKIMKQVGGSELKKKYTAKFG